MTAHSLVFEDNSLRFNMHHRGLPKANLLITLTKCFLLVLQSNKVCMFKAYKKNHWYGPSLLTALWLSATYFDVKTSSSGNVKVCKKRPIFRTEAVVQDYAIKTAISLNINYYINTKEEMRIHTNLASTDYFSSDNNGRI